MVRLFFTYILLCLLSDSCVPQSKRGILYHNLIINAHIDQDTVFVGQSIKLVISILNTSPDTVFLSDSLRVGLGHKRDMFILVNDDNKINLNLKGMQMQHNNKNDYIPPRAFIEYKYIIDTSSPFFYKGENLLYFYYNNHRFKDSNYKRRLSSSGGYSNHFDLFLQ